jgi:hypothetical protein
MLGRLAFIFIVFTALLAPLLEVSAEQFWATRAEYLVQYKDLVNPVAMRLSAGELLKVQSDPRVSLVELNVSYQKANLPNDYYINNQWYLKRIRADRAWSLVHDSPEMVVAVIDSGVQISHPDLKNNIWVNKKEIAGNGRDDDKNGFVDDINGWDFVNNVADPAPKFKLGYSADGVVHGTVIAGVLAASGDNRTGVAGVTWSAQIMPLKALDDRGLTDTVKVVAAINYAVAQKVNVINLSFIGANYSRSLEEAIRRAYQAGIVVVAAGGNELGQGFGQSLTDKPMYPVCLDGSATENMVIGVAATDSLDRKANFSGYGNCIDIAAPGIGIYSTSVYAPKQNKAGAEFDQLYDGYWSGTSLAVPMVSGAVALIAQINPLLRPDQIKALLLESVDKTSLINDSYADRIGTGRLNLYAAVAKALMTIGKHKNDLLLSDRSGNLYQWPVNAEAKKLAKLPVTENKIWSLGNSFVTSTRNKLKIIDSAGKTVKEWTAFEDAKASSLAVAVANVNADQALEIITAVNVGGLAPEIRIFDQNGKLLNKFLAYQANFRGGVNLAAGDIDNLGRAQIVTVPAGAGSAHLRMFNERGQLLSQFMAVPASLRGNFQVAVSDNYSSVRTEGRIIFYYADGSSPEIKVFNKDGVLRRSFRVSDAKKLTGLSVAVADLDDDGRAEISCLVTDKNGTRLLIHRDNGILFKSLVVDTKVMPNVNNLNILRLSAN